MDASRNAGFELGQMAYALQWEGNFPVLVSGRIVARTESELVIEEADGRLFSSRRVIAREAAYADAAGPVQAEMQWLRWFAPYDRVDTSERAMARERRRSALRELNAVLPCSHRFWQSASPRSAA